MDLDDIIKLIGLLLLTAGPGIGKAIKKAQERRPAPPRAPVEHRLPPTPRHDVRPPPPRRPAPVHVPVPVSAPAEPRVRRPTSPPRPKTQLRMPTLFAPIASARGVGEETRPRVPMFAGAGGRGHREALRRAIVLAEILGPPSSERGDRY
jgi:hypothetical protein